jgi:hypothetical protein
VKERLVKLSLGRTLIIKGLQSNGSDEHPAIVARVWSDAMANVWALPDAGSPVWRSSVTVVADRVAAEQYLKRGIGEVVCFWPERV